jgi:HlyD family secretion protein
MIRLKKPVVVSVCVIIVASAAALIHSRSSQKKPAAPPRTVAVSYGDIRDIVSDTGIIEPLLKVDVKSKVAGKLLNMPIEEGQPVQKGQLIAEVDRSVIDPQIASDREKLLSAQAALAQSTLNYKMQIDKDILSIKSARASLNSAICARDVTVQPPRPQDVAQDREAVARAQVSLDDAQRTYKRKSGLFSKGFVPESDVDTAKVALDNAKSNLATAQEALSLLLAGPTKQTVAQANASVDTAKVELDSALVNAEEHKVSKLSVDQAKSSVAEAQHALDQDLVNLGDTHIVAPISGIVLKKYKALNEIVQSATTGYSDEAANLVTLGQGAQVKVGINEIDVARLAVGQHVEVQADALKGATLAGVVAEIAPVSTDALSSSTSSSGVGSISRFTVRIRFVKPQPVLRPGMSASVTIITKQKKHVLLLPAEALDGDVKPGWTTVQVLPTGAKTPVSKKVLIGMRTDYTIEVVSGLKEGDLVVEQDLSSEHRKIDLTGDNSM